jgi:hypothetical protein
MKSLAVLSTALFVLATAGYAQQPTTSGIPAHPGPLTARYQNVANRILAAAETDTDGYAALTYLCDRIGNRHSGSSQLNTAVAWGAELMRKAGLENVHVESVMVPHWVRGHEQAALIAPIARPLHMLGLGMSVGTPAGGITAPVVFVHSFDELDALPRAAVSGKIVVFNPGWHGYGTGSNYRVNGPSRAAAKGAVAVLVRSATGLALQTPHTGTLLYDPAQPKIPAAALSVEDALLIERLAKDGPVTVHLAMEAHQEADVASGNVIGELRGTEHPEQIVVLGGHIDSWDVGQGAQDDGAGIMAPFEAVSLLHKLGLRPKNTIRLVFWVNEENGSAGAAAYYKNLGPEGVALHRAAIEMDGGSEPPLGIGYAGFDHHNFDLTKLPKAQKTSFEAVEQIAALLKLIGADRVFAGGGGEDIEPLTSDGVASLSPQTSGAHYFDWHHTEADTLDKVDPVAFRHNIALLAVTSYILADADLKLTGAK